MVENIETWAGRGSHQLPPTSVRVSTVLWGPLPFLEGEYHGYSAFLSTLVRRCFSQEPSHDPSTKEMHPRFN